MEQNACQHTNPNILFVGIFFSFLKKCARSEIVKSALAKSVLRCRNYSTTSILGKPSSLRKKRYFVKKKTNHKMVTPPQVCEIIFFLTHILLFQREQIMFYEIRQTPPYPHPHGGVCGFTLSLTKIRFHFWKKWLPLTLLPDN